MFNHIAQRKFIDPHIISQIEEFAETRKGVMIFAATVEHAREITGLLPSGDAALITGETPGPEREIQADRFGRTQNSNQVDVGGIKPGGEHRDVYQIAKLLRFKRLNQAVALRAGCLAGDPVSLSGKRLGAHHRV